MAAFNVDDVTAKLKDCDIGHEIIYKRETTSNMDDAEDGARAGRKTELGCCVWSVCVLMCWCSYL